MSPRQLVMWSSTGRRLEGPRTPDAKRREPTAEYFERIPVYPNETGATAAKKVLEGFTRRLPEAKSLAALLAEKNLGAAEGTTADDVYGTRFALLSWGALGQYERLAEAVADPGRPYAREAAIIALRSSLACEPEGEEAFTTAAETKFRISKPDIEKWLRRLSGPTSSERTDPAALDQLVADLAAPEVAQRELAFHILLQDIDPDSRRIKMLAGYDAGAPVEVRETMVKAWRNRVNEIKAAIREMPQP